MTSNACVTTPIHSSGSIVSASAVEPTTSANSAVTGFRSPVTGAARSFSRRGGGAADVSRRSRSSVEGYPSAIVRSSRSDPPLGKGYRYGTSARAAASAIVSLAALILM
jgi:hypothetical protein